MLLNNHGISKPISSFPEIISSLKDNKVNSSPPPAKIDRQTPRLVLHFDINETVLVGDDAGGDTRQDCLNKILAKSAFVKLPENVWNGDEPPTWSQTKRIVPTHWWDGTPIEDNHSTESCESSDEPPTESFTSLTPLYTGWKWPKYTCPYYRTAFKKRAKTFTEHHGSKYRPLYEEMERRLSVDCSNAKLDIQEHHPFHHMLPSFFHTLHTLQEQGRQYTVVLRTFGSDLPDIAMALCDFAEGKHPLYPDFREPNLVLTDENLYRGQWKKDFDGCGKTKSRYELFPFYEKSAPVVASGDDEVLNLIEGKTVCGIQDDYRFWSQNKCEPWAGKPIWVREYENNENGHYHLFFDDNIHNDPTDSIVAVQFASSSSSGDSDFRSLNGHEVIEEQGRHVIRVPTIEPIMNDDWFLQQIESALDKA